MHILFSFYALNMLILYQKFVVPNKIKFHTCNITYTFLRSKKKKVIWSSGT